MKSSQLNKKARPVGERKRVPGIEPFNPWSSQDKWNKPYDYYQPEPTDQFCTALISLKLQHPDRERCPQHPAFLNLLPLDFIPDPLKGQADQNRACYRNNNGYYSSEERITKETLVRDKYQYQIVDQIDFI